MSGFYRARVLEAIDSSHLRVQYVDYGLSEVLPISNLSILIERANPPVETTQYPTDENNKQEEIPSNNQVSKNNQEVSEVL